MKAVVKKAESLHFDKQVIKRYFKLINIGEKMEISCECIDRKYVKFKSASLILSSIKLVDTIEAVSYEGQRLSGKKLILCGYIDTKFFLENEDYCLYIKKNIPVSTFIVIPKDTIDYDVKNLSYNIEDVTIINIECNCIFISVTLYIEYLVRPEIT